jgi:hypothetical protein
MTYQATLEQIARSGTVICETSFGLSFTFTLVQDQGLRTLPNGARYRVGQKRHRVITLLSKCCQSKIDVHDKVIPLRATCHKCNSVITVDKELIDFELPEDSNLALEKLEAILWDFMEDSFTSVIVANSLLGIIEETFDHIKSGERIREFVSIESEKQII